jgi:tRNA A-37 threonylcarbamoyl transferase component Bud32
VEPPDNFVLRKQGGVRIWIDDKITDQTFHEAIADPDSLFVLPDCRIVKDQRKIKVARLQLKIAGREQAFYVKRYNSFSLRFRLLSPFFQSGALRALKGAEILRRGHIPSAKPVAAIEKREYGMLLYSVFISEEIVGGKTADAYWCENLQNQTGPEGIHARRQFIQRLGELFRSLHTERVYHDDLKDANILAVSRDDDAGCDFLLLDLEGVRRHDPLSDKRQVKNLVQLYRTLGQYFSKTQCLLFLKGYLGASFRERNGKRERIARVLRRVRSVDRLKRQKVIDAVS